MHQTSDLVIGVHIRRGDYATWNDGRFFYELEDYHQFMLRIQDLYKSQRVSFFISSNEDFSLDVFQDCDCRRFDKEPSGAILDLYTLSMCDRIIGPFSCYSRWASFIGEVPLCFLETKDQQFTEDSFSRLWISSILKTGKRYLTGKQMKIAIVTAGTLPVPAVRGGAVENLIDFYLEYNDTHKLHDITVYSISQQGIKKHSAVRSNVNHYVFIEVFSYLSKIRKAIFNKLHRNLYYNYAEEYFLCETIKHISRTRYDVIVIENRPAFVLKIKPVTDAKIVCHLGNDYLNLTTPKCMDVYNQIDGIITVSNFISNRVKTINPHDDKCHTVYNGIRTESFYDAKPVKRKNIGLNENDFVLVYSGRLTHEKGVLELIKSMNLLTDIPSLKLLIIGANKYGKDAENEPFLQLLKREADPNVGRIIFTGFINYTEIPSYLKVANIAVVPSMWEEPFGLTVVEAMAAGLPLITTNSGGIPEICNDFAIIVNRRDIVKNITESIRDLYFHPERREEMSYKALKESQKYDKDGFSRHFFSSLEEMFK